jgi:hypothetical protein
MSRAIIILSLLAFACNNLEDAAIPERNTYIRFFGSPRSYQAVAAEQDTDGGFIIIGNVEGDPDLPQADPASHPSIVVIKTNAQGVRSWEKIIPDARASSILPMADGYLITGDGIELNPGSAETSELENFTFRLMKIDLTGINITQEFSKDSTVTVNRGANTIILKVDFHAAASVLLPGGQIATLGSFQVPGDLERIITVGFNATDLTTPIWRKNFNLDNFDYLNARSLSFTQGNLVWASTASPQNPNESKYISVIAAPPNYASPANNSLLGKNEDRAHVVNDIQRSATGFAVIGNFSERDGSESNVFFGKVDPAGTIISSSVRYFNGHSEKGDLTVEKSDAGSTQDFGDAITYTRDGGFVLACSMAENPLRGNGGLDIILIKVDAFGNYLWDKLLGGSGNEKVNSIRELADGTLLICGTEEISNVSSIFIIKTDHNGELKD